MSDRPDCSGHGHNLTETGTIRTTESDRTHFGSPESELQPVSNRLANETSPYLLQHKDNPVDWYPWGPEALERSKREFTVGVMADRHLELYTRMFERQ